MEDSTRRLSDEEWAEARLEWESDPKISLTFIANKYGLNKASVSRRAQKDGWQKIGELSAINEVAQRKADTIAIVAQQKNNDDFFVKSTFSKSIREIAEDKRAEILARHRCEWEELESYRQISLQAMKTAKEIGDKEEWQKAKMAADTILANLRALEMKQNGERRAWGLNTLDNADGSNQLKAVKIVWDDFNGSVADNGQVTA